LEINAELARAYRLRADWLLADLWPQQTIEMLNHPLKINPRDELALGRLLAAYSSIDPPAKPSARIQEIVDQADKHNPHCGELFLAAADSFDRMRRYPQAATY